MYFFSIFGPTINNNNESANPASNPSQVNPTDVISNIFSSEIQDLLQPILSGSQSTASTSTQVNDLETQTSTANSDESTTAEEIFYFENVNNNNSPITINELNESTTLEINTSDDETKTSDEEMICVICHNAIEKNTIYRKINSCEHCFHVKCIDEWLNQNSTCPTCRVELIGNRRSSSSSRTRRNNTGSFSFPLYSFRYV
jgi:hypothetical protein